MRLLLDTHALIWLLTDHPRLSMRLREAFANPDSEVLASAVSAYEIGFKCQIGKLPKIIAAELVPMLRRTNIRTFPITFEHATKAAALPPVHRDPWDRILMAQSGIEEAAIATLDPVFAQFGVATFW